MTNAQIALAVKCLRSTIQARSTMPEQDLQMLRDVSRMARKTATVEARMRIMEATITSHDEQMARFWKTRARGLRAKNSEINALLVALGNSRPVLKDCIGGTRPALPVIEDVLSDTTEQE